MRLGVLSAMRAGAAVVSLCWACCVVLKLARVVLWSAFGLVSVGAAPDP